MKPVCSIVGVLAIAALCTDTQAQSRCVAPSIGNAGTASTSTSYPWNRRNGNVRVQYCYDPSEIPGTSVLLITRIKFRPADTTATSFSWLGGTYGDVEIKMSHSSKAYNQITTNFATEDQFIFGLRLGFDVPFGDSSWSFSSSIDYTDMELEIEVPGFGGNVPGTDLEPLSIGVGVAYSF